jgi:S-adenosylmethionine synthetase
VAGHGRYLFTSESVTEGHPDKVADQISDAVLDEIMRQDPQGRVACEVLVTTGLTLIAGEITTKGSVDYAKVARQTILGVGYNRPDFGFDGNTCGVISTIDEQSPDIAMGVDTGGAGDQGLMFGFATNETEELMPMPIMMAHKLTQRLAEVRRQKILDWVRPDGKSQVTVRYEDYRPVHVETVVVSTQHSPDVDIEKVRRDVLEHVIYAVVPERLRDPGTIYHINPTGRFAVGGPQGDCGLTGRKIIVDTYGGYAHHGGGAFSGKDPSKVDRSASYMARYLAKNVVAAGIADRIEIQIAYAIGVAEPVSLMADSFGTGRIPDDRIEEILKKSFSLTPRGIMECLDLRRPIYKKTASYGHFGRSEPEFSWERTDRAAELADRAGTRVMESIGR